MAKGYRFRSGIGSAHPLVLRDNFMPHACFAPHFLWWNDSAQNVCTVHASSLVWFRCGFWGILGLKLHRCSLAASILSYHLCCWGYHLGLFLNQFQKKGKPFDCSKCFQFDFLQSIQAQQEFSWTKWSWVNSEQFLSPQGQQAPRSSVLISTVLGSSGESRETSEDASNGCEFFHRKPLLSLTHKLFTESSAM